jgi:hypothetical protein
LSEGPYVREQFVFRTAKVAHVLVNWVTKVSAAKALYQLPCLRPLQNATEKTTHKRQPNGAI